MASLEDSDSEVADTKSDPGPFNIKKNLLTDLEDEAKAPDVTAAPEIIPIENDQMRVFLRVRPLSNGEKDSGEDKNCVKVENEHTLVTYAPKDSNTYKNASHRLGKGVSQKFTFSKIFHDNTSQRQFFDEAVFGTVKDFINGQNCLVFTYGVTNSGKTYTIQGLQNDVGILPRALDMLFNSINDRQWEGTMLKPHMFCDVVRLRPYQEDEEKKIKNSILKMADTAEEPDAVDVTINMSRLTADSTMSEDSLMRQSIASATSMMSHRESGDLDTELLSVSQERLHDETAVCIEDQGDIKFSIWVSFAEIYNENIHDLLEPLTNKRKSNKGRPVLTLREDKNGTPYVRGLKEVFVTSADEAYRLLTVGKKNLQVACTKLNRTSSRSHCIFTIKMLRVVDKSVPNMARMSMLSFCDLAGSERYTKTQSFGDRIKEAGNINTSLLTLGRCIQILRHNQTNKDHPQVVPFRESKLTRLFQSFFCGKGKASMIVNINKCASTFDETLHALKYSAIAKQIIVVQEPEKPKKISSERHFSMLLNQNCRQTIGWATPGTCAKVFQEEEALEEVDEEDEDTSSETEKERELLELVELLKQKLIEEKRKQLMLEVRIRDEVSREMSQQLVEIETHYSERLKREQAHQEEKAERRLEILSKSVYKARKRQRIFDDDENEEYVSSILLHAEQVKVQKAEKETQLLQEKLSELTAELDQLKETVSISGKERDKLQQENTAVKFQLKQQEISKNKDDQSMAALGDSADTGDLSVKLSETESELEQQREAVTKLQQVIDILQCNGAEADDTLRHSQKELAESKKQLAAIENELSEKTTALDELKEQLEHKDAKEKDMQAQVSQQDEQLQLLQTELEQLSQELEKVTQESQQQDGIVEALREKVLQQQAEYEKLQCSAAEERDGETQKVLQVKDEEIEALKTKLEEQEKETASFEEIKAQFDKDLTAAREQLEEFSATREDLENVRTEVTSCQRQLDEASNLVIQREQELEQVKSSLEEQAQADQNLKEELKTNSEKEDELIEEITALKTDLSTEKAEKETLAEQLKVREEENQMVLLEGSKMRQDLENQLSEMESEKAKVESELRVALDLQTALEQDISSLHEGLQQAKDQLEKAGSDHIVAVSQLQAKIAEFQTSAESVLENGNKITELTGEVDSLRKEMEDKEQKLSDLQTSFDAEKEEFQTKVSDLETQLGTSQSEVKHLTKELNHKMELHKEAHKQLEDYILKVNEQAEQIGDLSETKDTQAKEAQERFDNELKIQKDLLAREREKFTEKISELEEAIKTQETMMTNAENDLKKSKNSYEELERKLSGCKMTMEMNQEEAESLTEEHENEMTKLRSELQEKVTKLADLELELEGLRSEANGQEKNKTDTQEEIDNLKKNILSLQQKLDDAEYNHQMACRQMRREKSNVEKLLKTSEEAGEELQRRIEELSSQIEELEKFKQDQEATLKTEVDKHKSRSSKLEEAVKDLEICLTSSKEHESKANNELQNFKLRCRKLEEECNTKEDTICSLNEEMDRFREESIMHANHSNSETTAQLDSLRREVMECKKAMDDLEVELKDIREEKIMIERESEQKEAEAKSEIDHLKESIINMETTVTDIRSEKEEIAGKLEDMISQLNNFQTESAEEQKLLQKEFEQKSELAESRISKFEQQISELENDIHEYKTQNEETLAKLQDATYQLAEAQCSSEEEKQARDQSQKEKEEKLSELESRLKECEDIISSQEVKLSELKSKNESLTEQLEKASSQIEEFEGKSVDASDRIEEAELKLEELKEQLKEANTNLETKSKELDDQKQELEIMESKKMDLDKETDFLKGKLEESQVALDQRSVHSSEQVEVLESQLKDKEKELHSAEENVHSKEKELSESRKTIQSLEEKMETMKSQLSAESKDLQSQLIAKTNELSELQNMLERREKALEKLKSQKMELDTRIEQSEDKVRELSSSSKESKVVYEQLQTKCQELSDSRDSINKHVQKCADLEEKCVDLEEQLKNMKNTRNMEKEELSNLRTQIEETERKLQETEVRCKCLQEELATCQSDLKRKEQRLISRGESLTTFMNKMEQERAKYELALNDAQSNEMMIEKLKKCLEEQEGVMQSQDQVVQNREDELKQLEQDLNRHVDLCTEHQKREREMKDSYKSLREEKEDIERQLKRLTKEKEETLEQFNAMQQLQKSGCAKDEELETLRRSRDRMEERLANARKRQEEAEKQLRDQSRTEQDLKETNQELQKTEKKLKESSEELSSLRKQLETLRTQQAESSLAQRNDAEASARDTQSLGLLKTKFQALEEQVRLLEVERDQWKTRAQSTEDHKAQELMKWREERDKLVGNLEGILKAKDEEIKNLKQGGDNQLISKLEEELEDKNATIEQLSSHLGSSAPGGRRRRHRSTKNSSSEDDPENLRREKENLRKQLDHVKHDHQQEVNKIIRAKDAIIDDMKNQNQKLMGALSGGETSDPSYPAEPSTPCPAASVISHHGDDQADAPDHGKHKTRRGRPPKRKSSEFDQSEDSTASLPSTGKRGRKKQTRGKSAHNNENDPSLTIISEEGVIDLDDYIETPQKANVLATISNTTVIVDEEEHDNTGFVSPKTSPAKAPSAGQKHRKKRLKATAEEPLMDSPVDPAADLPVPNTPAQQIVKRKLRSRRK